MRLTNKKLNLKIKEVEKYILKKYQEESKKKLKSKKRDYPQYERDFMIRIKFVIRNLEPLIKDACKIKVCRAKGHPPKLTLEQRMRVFLIKTLVDKSNRNMAYMLDLFCLISGIEIGYKTVERLYSNQDLRLALENLHQLLIKKREIKNPCCSGDATGYSLEIKKHYASYVQKLKEKSKKQDGRKKKKSFVYKFSIMDINTRMYLCYGSSLRSEKEAYDKAIKMLRKLGLKIKDLRLDKYYSFPKYVKELNEIKIYILPRKNAKLGHGNEWYSLMKEFVEDTWNYLEEYFQRNNSENAFGVDKKLFGSRIRQKKKERIDCAIFSKMLWHNLVYLYG